jgi:hypothetical protein
MRGTWRAAAVQLLARLGIAAGSYFLVILAVLLFEVRHVIMVIAWPYFAVVGLWLYAWPGIVGLVLGSWVLGGIVGRLPDFRAMTAVKFAFDLAAGAAVSWIFYAGNSVFLYCGFGITVVYAVLVRLASRFRRSSQGGGLSGNPAR